METKTCSRCGLVKPVEELKKRKCVVNGIEQIRYDSPCKSCMSLYMKEWNKANAERVNEERRKKRLENNKEANLRARDYYHAHKEKISKDNKQYRECHKEEISQRKKKAYQQNILERREQSRNDYYKNREKILARLKTPERRYQNYLSSAKRRHLEITFTFEEFKDYFWNKDCVYCGKPIVGVGIDRIDSSLGYTLANCVPCHKRCNEMKNNVSIKQWIEEMRTIVNRYDDGFLSLLV